MLRLRRSCPMLGQQLLFQRRRAGKSGHAQRTSCSSPNGIKERWEAKKRRVEGGGGLPVRPLCSRSVLADFTTHLIYFSRDETLEMM